MDVELFYLINGFRNVVLDWIMLLVSYLGEFGVVFIIIGLLSLFLDKKNGKKLVIMFVVAIGLKFVICDLFFKSLIFRVRPFLVLENVFQMGKVWLNSSFPSGHSFSAFAGAVIFGSKYKKLRVWLFVFAFLTLYSRVYLGMHYPSDVVFGGLFGYVIGSFVVWVDKGKYVEKYIKIFKGK